MPDFNESIEAASGMLAWVPILAVSVFVSVAVGMRRRGLNPVYRCLRALAALAAILFFGYLFALMGLGISPTWELHERLYPTVDVRRVVGGISALLAAALVWNSLVVFVDNPAEEAARKQSAVEGVDGE